MEFIYTNRGPSPWNVIRSNLIRLRREGDKVIFNRHFLTDGKPSNGIIGHEFTGNEINAAHIARMIHWGCCGWSDRGTTQLIQNVELFLSTEVKP